MQKKRRFYLSITGGLLVLAALFTWVVKTVDVRPIGPEHSKVGLATINRLVFDALGVHLLWYTITDWLGVAAILVAMGSAAAGCAQLIKRKSLKRVDAGILLLGVFYLLMIAVYVLFESCIVNYRPILLHTALEASYPSSHTMLVFCILSTAMIRFHATIRRPALRVAAMSASAAVIAVTVVGRCLSGVHWVTDMVGGLLIGSSLLMAYYCATKLIAYKQEG